MNHVFALNEGCFSVDKTKSFIPFDPQIHQTKDRPASIFIHVQPFLIQTETDLILIDAGLGWENSNGIPMIHQNIRNVGFEPEDVSLVLLSHLHYDHIGGLIYKQGEKHLASFPNAKHIIQQQEWNYTFEKGGVSYRTSILEMLQQQVEVCFVEGHGFWGDNIYYEVTGGHCPFHQVFIIQTPTGVIFYGGDIVPEPEQLLRRFMAKYDFDPRKALESRMHYGERATKEDWTCLFYHAKEKPICKVGLENNNFYLKN